MTPLHYVALTYRVPNAVQAMRTLSEMYSPFLIAPLVRSHCHTPLTLALSSELVPSPTPEVIRVLLGDSCNGRGVAARDYADFHLPLYWACNRDASEPVQELLVRSNPDAALWKDRWGKKTSDLYLSPLGLRRKSEALER